MLRDSSGSNSRLASSATLSTSATVTLSSILHSFDLIRASIGGDAFDDASKLKYSPLLVAVWPRHDAKSSRPVHQSMVTVTVTVCATPFAVAVIGIV